MTISQRHFPVVICSECKASEVRNGWGAPSRRGLEQPPGDGCTLEVWELLQENDDCTWPHAWSMLH